tara:strand:- start:43 stop:336 length:294 start_codon:yes stop_codon:yes gene_type:complete
MKIKQIPLTLMALFIAIVFILLVIAYRLVTDGSISDVFIHPAIDPFFWSVFILFVGYLRLNSALKSESGFDKFNNYFQAVFGLVIGLYLLVKAVIYV